MRPISFIGFCGKLGVELTQAQRLAALIAFDHVPISSLTEGDRALAAGMFGDVPEEIPETARAILVAVVGARSGKSYVFGALRALHLALVCPLGSLAPGEDAAALLVAPDLRLARQTLRYALGAAKRQPALARLIETETKNNFVIRRGNRRVNIECIPASAGGAAGRGRSLVFALMDEGCFFRDQNFAVNDEDVFKALAPRVMPGGQLVLCSTPWAESGLMYNEWSRNFGRPRSSLVLHASTELMRDDAHTRSMVARERERDPENARREFDAEFLSAGTGAVFDPEMIDRSVDPNIDTEPSDEHAVAGLDLGLSLDSSALCIVRRHDELIEIASLMEMTPKRGAPLVPSEVMSRVIGRCQLYGVRTIVCDVHYKELVQEHSVKAKIRVVAVPGGAEGKRRLFEEAQQIVHGGRLRIPPNRRLIQQLKEVTSSPLSGGGIKISSPRWRGGGHGDLVSALVAALHGFGKRRRSDSPARTGLRREMACGGMGGF